MATGTYPDTDDAIDGELVSTGDALMALNSSEINQQIATAKRYPRSVREFVREATEMVTLSEEIASECMYSLKRKDKDGNLSVIEGPSARFAEVICSAWGNCRAGARQIGEDDRFVTSQGAFIDLQRNVAITYETKRRISNKFGKKFSDDMVGVTSNAASSIALRNAVLKGIPKAFWQQVYLKARETAVGSAETLGARRRKMVEYFGKMGVSPETIFAFLEIKGEADITLDHLALLKGIATAIKEGDTSVDQAFTHEDHHEPPSRAKKSTLGEQAQPPAPADEAAADLVQFQERCAKAVTLQEVTEADAALRGPNGRELTEAEATIADETMAAAMKRIRGSRGERSNKQTELV